MFWVVTNINKYEGLFISECLLEGLYGWSVPDCISDVNLRDPFGSFFWVWDVFCVINLVLNELDFGFIFSLRMCVQVLVQESLSSNMDRYFSLFGQRERNIVRSVLIRLYTTDRVVQGDMSLTICSILLDVAICRYWKKDLWPILHLWTSSSKGMKAGYRDYEMQ